MLARDLGVAVLSGPVLGGNERFLETLGQTVELHVALPYPPAGELANG
jgi:hypothetical protein